MKIIKTVILLFIILSSPLIFAQEGFDWQEPSFIMTDLGGRTRGVSVMDIDDNIYTIGLFNESVEIGDSVLYSSLEDGVFLAKYDVNQTLLWTKVLAVAKMDNPIASRVIQNVSIEVDDLGQVYPVIIYTDSIYIDGQLQVVDQSLEIFANSTVLKLDEEGDVLEMFHISGSCRSSINDIKITDALFYELQINKHDTDILDSCSCIINGDTTMYEVSHRILIGQLDTSIYQSIWQKELVTESGSHISGREVVIQDSNLYITGVVSGNRDLIYGEDTLVMPNVFNNYIYLIKLDINGDFKWWQYAAVQGWDSFISVSDLFINTENDILLSLNLKSETVFNQFHFSNSSSLLGAAKNDGSFAIVNYDKYGNVKWKDISNSVGWETSIGLTADDDNNVFLSSSFEYSIVFGNDTILAEDSGKDMLLASYSQSGLKRWSNVVSGPGGEDGGKLFTDSEGNIHVFGTISSSIMRLGSLVAYPPNGGSFYLAKLEKHPLSIVDYDSEHFDISLWPNPNNGEFVIELEQEHFSRVCIYNALGQKIKNENPDEFTNRIQISDLQKGFYLVEILTKSGKQASGKFVVE